MTARSWSVTDLEARLALTSAQAHARATWAERWAPQPLPRSGVIVVTGATGVFGRHLVRTLLKQGHAVMAPVRAPDYPQARARLAAALGRDPAFVWPEDRLSAVPWSELEHWVPPTEGLLSVCHSAADLSLAASVDTVWATHVALTAQMVALAQRHGARRFDHISTLSVWVAGQTPAGRCVETDDLRRAERVSGGYAASKWAAEWAVPAWAGDLPVAIHRLGLLTVGPSEGWLDTDPVAATSAAWARWGTPCALPADADAVAFDWSAVDTVAEGVAQVIGAGGLGPFHYAAQAPVTGAQWWHAHHQGGPVQAWPATDPLGKVARRALGRWLQPGRQGWWMDLFQSSAHRYDTTRAQGLGVAPWCPPDPLPTLQPRIVSQ